MASATESQRNGSWEIAPKEQRYQQLFQHFRFHQTALTLGVVITEEGDKATERVPAVGQLLVGVASEAGAKYSKYQRVVFAHERNIAHVSEPTIGIWNH